MSKIKHIIVEQIENDMISRAEIDACDEVFDRADELADGAIFDQALATTAPELDQMAVSLLDDEDVQSALADPTRDDQW